MVVFNDVTVLVRNQTSGTNPVGQSWINEERDYLAGKLSEDKGGIKERLLRSEYWVFSGFICILSKKNSNGNWKFGDLLCVHLKNIVQLGKDDSKPEWKKAMFVR